MKRDTAAVLKLESGNASPSTLAQLPADQHFGHAHSVQFYENERFLGSVVSEFLARGLAIGQPVVVIATGVHRRAFVDGLAAIGVDVASARNTGQLTLLDAHRTLERFMNGTSPDPRRFERVIGRVLDKAVAGRPGAVCAYGEMVDLLWKGGNPAGAVELEDLWNDLASRYNFSLLCAYSMGNFERVSDAEQFQRICAQHTHVVPTEQYLEQDDAARLREISALQQRARSLEAEIAQREALEARLREALANVQAREADLRDVLENAAEGIHLVRSDGTIHWANSAEVDLLGYRPEEYIGRNITEFHADPHVIADMLARLTRGEELREVKARLRHRDGTIRHVLVNSNVRFHDGEFIHTRCFTRDITRLETASQEVEAALEDARIARTLAEQANRAKSEFLAVMSHELRTPLNAIGGHAELMELGIHGPVTEQQRDALERIQRSQRLLLGLVNQVLNYARVESGSIRYAITEVPLDEALRSAEGLIIGQIRARGLKYNYDGCAPDVVVRADAEKLQQVLLNLLTNATKFTDAGGAIQVAVRTGRKAVMIDVSDTGVGIAPEKLDMIFDAFVQVDANYTRTRDGVGLGLAISRDLIQGMGGTLTVRSTKGMGSTFTCTFPVQDA